MKEVSHIAVRVMLEDLGRRGIEKRLLVRTTAAENIDFTGSGRIDWALFVELNERFAEIVGGSHELVRTGQYFYKSKTYKLVSKVLRITIGLPGMYMVLRQFFQYHFASLRSQIIRIDERTLQVTVTIPPHLVDCPIFLNIVQGWLACVPQVVGRQPAEVQALITTRRGYYTLHLPEEKGFRYRVSHVIRRLFVLLQWKNVGMIRELVETVSEISELNLVLMQEKKIAEARADLFSLLYTQDSPDRLLNRVVGKLRHHYTELSAVEFVVQKSDGELAYHCVMGVIDGDPLRALVLGSSPFSIECNLWSSVVSNMDWIGTLVEELLPLLIQILIGHQYDSDSDHSQGLEMVAVAAPQSDGLMQELARLKIEKEVAEYDTEGAFRWGEMFASLHEMVLCKGDKVDIHRELILHLLSHQGWEAAMELELIGGHPEYSVYAMADRCDSTTLQSLLLQSDESNPVQKVLQNGQLHCWQTDPVTEWQEAMAKQGINAVVAFPFRELPEPALLILPSQDSDAFSTQDLRWLIRFGRILASLDRYYRT